MPAPNLGPQYDLASRISQLEDQVRRLQQNPLGQAFSATQSDGSVGMRIYQDPTTGSTSMVFYQGPTASRDPNTGLHPLLAYFGELFSGGVAVDSGVLLYRPDGVQSAVIGNRGVQIFDGDHNQVFATDEYGSSPSNEGLSRPWLTIDKPAATAYALWPHLSASGLLAESFFIAQQSHVFWNGSVYADAGVSGSVQASVTIGSTTITGATHSYSGSQVNISETIAVPQPFHGSTAVFAINATVTGTGNLYCQTWQLNGQGSS